MSFLDEVKDEAGSQLCKIDTFIVNQNLPAVASDPQKIAGTVPVATQYLCIGKYSDLSGPTAWAADYQLGKLAFYDHHLNQTERSLLYETMVS